MTILASLPICILDNIYMAHQYNRRDLRLFEKLLSQLDSAPSTRKPPHICFPTFLHITSKAIVLILLILKSVLVTAMGHLMVY